MCTLGHLRAGLGKWAPRKNRDHPKWARYAVIFDCETRIDLRQELTFGVFRVCELRGAIYVCIEDGLFAPDNLPTKERKVLEDYTDHHPSDIAPEERGPATKLHLCSYSGFVEKVFYKYAHQGAMICGFNLPFDLSRIAKKWSEGHKNEWSLQLMESANGRNSNPLYPNILIEPLDSKKAFIRFAAQGIPSGCTSSNIGQARFFDLRTALWGLFNKSYSLKSACDNEKGPFKGRNLPQKIDHKPIGRVTLKEIEYALGDGRCTEGLLNEIKRAFDMHSGIDLDPDKLYSQATMAKAYLEAQQIKKPSIKFSVPNKIHAIAMNAYAGAVQKRRCV